MKKSSAVALVLFLALTSVGIGSGCSYGGVATVDDNRVVIVRNGGISGRKVYVCDVTETGVSNCSRDESP